MLFSRRTGSRREPLPAPPDGPEQGGGLPGNGPGAESFDGALTQSYIDASLTIVGDLHSAGDVRIDGRICGNVRCAQLILGRDASITGTVVAAQTIVRGKIIGTIRSPVVVIQDTAHVESEIAYCSLAIDDGACFEGTVHHHDNPRELELAAAPPTERQAAAQSAESAPAARSKTAETEAAVRASNGKAPPGHGRAANGQAPTG
jgi:cytoskeletal protein CcmA (bactofilin family)